MKGENNRPIGIFDSGIGGLTVLKEIKRILPSENVIYFGDTARVPYGNKSKQTVIKFSTQSVLFLLKKKVKLIVIACNTASSLALDYLKKVFTVPLIGVIDPAINRALLVSRNKRIGVIGTKSTISSKVYERKILKKHKHAKVYLRACPLFVPCVEEGLTRGEIIDVLLKVYLKDLKGKIDTLILGCTHYPLLKRAITDYFKDVYLVDSASAVAFQIKEVLKKNHLLSKVPSSYEEFYVTDDSTNFAKLARLFLRREIKKPRVLNV